MIIKLRRKWYNAEIEKCQKYPEYFFSKYIEWFDSSYYYKDFELIGDTSINQKRQCGTTYSIVFHGIHEMLFNNKKSLIIHCTLDRRIIRLYSDMIDILRENCPFFELLNIPIQYGAHEIKFKNDSIICYRAQLHQLANGFRGTSFTDITFALENGLWPQFSRELHELHHNLSYKKEISIRYITTN